MIATTVLIAVLAHLAVGQQTSSFGLTELRPPSYFETDAKTMRSKRYYLSSIATDWFSARRACAESNFKLVQIKSADDQSDVEYHFLENDINGDVWIGLNDLRRNGSWEWDDGTLMVYSNWYPGHQSSESNTRNCASIEGGAFQWFDYPCKQGLGTPYIPMKFLCETP